MLKRRNLRILRGLWVCLYVLPSLAQGAGPDWMKGLADEAWVSRISIPGTHNSGADDSEPWPGTAICQNVSLTKQLNFGVRFLDLRCRHMNDAFAIYHGAIDQNLTMEAALAEIYTFLKAYPSECVLVSIKEEHSASGNTRNFDQTFDAYVSKKQAKWWLGSSIPKLGEMRGKIILIRRFHATGKKGIDATQWPNNTTFTKNKLRVQDNYAVKNHAEKWTHVSNSLHAAGETENSGTIHLNFASGYIKGNFGIPSIRAVSNPVNKKLDAYFTEKTSAHFGCVIMDFATAARCKLIYETNDVAKRDDGARQ